MTSVPVVVTEVLHELRTDLLEVLWFIAQQLRLDGITLHVTNEVVQLVNKRHGRYRSPIRYVASLIPTKPVPRVHFGIVTKEDELKSNLGSASPIESGLAIIPEMDRKIKVERWKVSSPRAKPNGMTSLRTDLGIAEDEGWNEDGDQSSIRSPSPISFCGDSVFSSQSTVDTMAMNKISALEDELARLREQIAKIVTNQTVAVPAAVPPPPPPPPPPMQGLPPPPPPPPPLMQGPPPPPPPPAVSSAKELPGRKLSLAESLQSKTLKSGPTAEDGKTLSRTVSVPSMTDVLKDMGKVKLKKIDRSPNGTPARSRNDVNTDDPAALIALALRKRFAQMNQVCESPDHEHEDRANEDRDSFSEPCEVTVTPRPVNTAKAPSPRKLFLKNRTEINSPAEKENNVSSGGGLPFGQHLLRKTGRLSDKNQPESR